MSKYKTVLIGTPHNGDFEAEYINSIIGMMFYSGHNNIQTKLHLFQSCLVHQARNKIMASCYDDYLLFVDSDMAFTQDMLVKLIELDKDIAGALYFMRKEPFLPTVYKANGDKYENITEYGDKPFQVDAMATGLMLIKKKVIEAFDGYVKKNNILPFDFFRGEKGAELGEDMAFCQRAKELGFEIWCDPTLPTGHVTKTTITANDFKAYEEVRKQNRGVDE